MAIQPLGPSVGPAQPVREKSTVKPVTPPDTQAAAKAAAPEKVAQQAAAQPSREQVDRAMNEVRRVIDPVARNLQFSIDEGTGRTVIRVVDASTKEVIRQIPSEELLQLSKTLESHPGLLIRQKV